MEMYTFKSSIAGAALAAVVALAATSASAFTFGDIPGGGVNEGLDDVYGTGTTTVDGYYGGQLVLFGDGATVTVEYLGAEAGFTNSFIFEGDTLFTTTGDSSDFDLTGTGSRTIRNVSNGLLDFAFFIDRTAFNAGTSIVENGSNPNGSTPDSDPNFFLTFQPSTGESAIEGTIVDLWLDDGGAGPDDNHDDMAIRLTVSGGTIGVVPVPASVPLLLTALGGLGIAARRRKKASKA